VGDTDSVEDVLFASSAEHNHTRSATQSTECFLMYLGPDARTGAKRQKACRLAATAEHHHEQSGWLFSPLACVGPGGHLIGRFCRRPPSPRTRRTHADTGRFQIGASRFSPAPRSPARCAATAIPVAPGLLVVVVSLRSRRCSCRQKLQPLMSESTSQTPTLVGRFSGDPHRPLLGDP